MDKSLAKIEQENAELRKLNKGLEETVTILLTKLNELQGIEKRPALEQANISPEEAIIERSEEHTSELQSH